MMHYLLNNNSLCLMRNNNLNMYNNRNDDTVMNAGNSKYFCAATVFRAGSKLMDNKGKYYSPSSRKNTNCC